MATPNSGNKRTRRLPGYRPVGSASGSGGETSSETQTTLNDVLDRYDIVQVHEEPGNQFMVVEPKQLAITSGRSTELVSTRELGTSSPSPFTSWMRAEYNYELRGLLGLQKYDKMRKGDGAVRGALRLVKTPILSARWFVEPASSSTRDVNAAKFVEECLNMGNNKRNMSISWPQILSETLLMLDFGWYMFEKVFEKNDQGKIVWKKMAPRHPMDIKEWKYDENGGPKAVVMYSGDPFMDETTIPIEKLLAFTNDREAGNMEGVSILRSAYKHWYFKEQLYKIDAIQKERHGIGIPVIKLPLGWAEKDRLAAEDLGRNLRTNERAHVVLPPNWELLFAKLEGQPVDALASINHHDQKIFENVLAQFMNVTNSMDADTGQDMFIKGTRVIADVIMDTWNTYAIPQLIDFNFQRVGYPKLRYRRIGEEADWRTISFAVRNLIGVGAIIPDEELETYLRSTFDLPLSDEDTRRYPVTLENPNDTDPPQGGQQQTPGGGDTPTDQKGNRSKGAPRQQPQPSTGPPRGNGGTDRSGGA